MTTELLKGQSLSKMAQNGKMEPVLCKCGYERPIGGDGAKVASFFYDAFHGEYVCHACGKIVVNVLDLED